MENNKLCNKKIIRTSKSAKATYVKHEFRFIPTS